MAEHEAPSSSSSSSSFTNYDVFLSFRGEDTRYGFTGNLYNALHQKGIHTFIDDEELRRGEEITPALLTAIQNSRIAIIVFSKNYASSSFCLDELVQIVECLKEEEGRSIFPVFYDVDPSHVRHQTETYSEALTQLGKRFKDEKVLKWRAALTQAANLSGRHYQHGAEPEYKFIQKIVEEVSQKINCLPLHVADNPFGLEDAVQEVKSLIGHESDVNMIGIHGIGGIGKTTVACAMYNSIFSHFEGMCFLSDIREKANKHGLVQLQETLLSETLKEKDIKVGDVRRGIPIIKRRLQQKKVLLVLDDVDKLEQLQALAGNYDWFGPGSVIIFTTRDKHLLDTHGVKKLYQAKPLNNEKALELFNRHAFKNAKADPSFVNISERAVSYACGLPLALEVIGSHLFGKSLDQCNSALDKYGDIPPEEIQKKLKVNYDGLEENEKEIFLDIACFFITCKVDYVKPVLHARGFHAEDGLRVLVDRSLIKIDDLGYVRMHDLIRDMGREIVRQESTLRPGERSRLWVYEEIISVWEENMGTDKIEFIKLQGCKNNILAVRDIWREALGYERGSVQSINLNYLQDEEYNYKQVQWNGESFKEMKNLSVLIIEDITFSSYPSHLPNSLRVLQWSRYPSSSLPADFNLKRLEILHMPRSCLQIFQPHKKFHSLSKINFENSKSLTHVLSLREVPFLTDLCLDYCTDLVKIDDSIGFLDKLRTLSAIGCIKLKSLAPRIMLPSLEILDLRWCYCLKSFPEVLGKMEKIRKIRLDETGIEKLPYSIGNLVGLEVLSLQACKRLNQLPRSICILPKVEVIFDYQGRGCRYFEGNKEEGLISEVSPDTILAMGYRYMPKSSSEMSQKAKLADPEFTYLDVYYPYISPNNVIQVCTPNPLLHFDLSSLLKKVDFCMRYGLRSFGKSIQLQFRNKFPKIALYVSAYHYVCPGVLTFTVLINGTKQFSCSCNYLSFERRKKLWCDIECKVEGIFSENEWNELEILCDLNCPDKRWRMGYLDWILIGVYKEGNNMEDIQLKYPSWSIFGSSCSNTLLSPSGMTHEIWSSVKIITLLRF